MVILPIPDQEVFQNVQLLPIGNRTPTTLFFLYIYICNRSSSIDKEPISLTYANAIQSFPRRSPHEIIRFKAMDICHGILNKQTDQKKKKKTKKQKTKAFRIKSLQPPNQNVVNIKEVLEQFVNMILKPGLDHTILPG